MNPEMQKRLYEMEVAPPVAVWQKLSQHIDEINEDNRVAKKVLAAELVPPPSVWEKIDSSVHTIEERGVQKKGRVINFRRIAVAAVFVGLIVTSWVWVRNIGRNSSDLAGIEPTQQKTSTDTNTTKENKAPDFIDSPIDLNRTVEKADRPVSSSGPNIASVTVQPQPAKKRKNSSTGRKDISVQQATAQFASLNEPLENNFNEPIDDLSLVTSNQNYLTMVNANGRLVKIPPQLASLAPHLQDKPVTGDYYEVMFGEGAYWKETLHEWRKKVASAPVSTGDAFTSFVELLKNVQNK